MGKKYTIWTRANGFPDWVDVGQEDTIPDFLQRIEYLKKQDDPMWAKAEYRVTNPKQRVVYYHA